MIGLLTLVSVNMAIAQTNYDETQVPDYTLPELLVRNNGQTVKSVRDWEKYRRPEILSLFETHVHGKTLAEEISSFEVTSVDKNALGGQATRKEISLYLSADKSKSIQVLLYVPNKRKGPAPLFVGLNYAGNQSVSKDPDVQLTKLWTRYGKEPGFPDGYAAEGSRGFSERRWPLELIIENGYGVATAYYGDVQLDRADIDEGDESFHHWFEQQTGTKKEADSWGSIGVWAWELSKIMDYLEEDPDVNHERVAVVGHSRLGKTALWAAAQDQRFALAISNNSGEGGAALARRQFGERIADLNKNFPHWFADNFKLYDGKESELPVDFHQLIALIAPRPVYVASASEDRWADPKGEYLSLYHASPVYQLYGEPTLSSDEPPAVGETRLEGKQGYHIREGKHDILAYDWERYIRFADRYLK